MTFTYADGMVYAFGFDSVTHENSEGGPGIAVFASRYDMNAGTWDSFEEVARTAPENGSLVISRTLFATSYKGKIYLGFTANVRKPMSPDIDDDDEVLLPKVNFYTLSAPTGSKDFSLSARDITGATYAPISFVTGNQSSLGLLRADDTATYLSWLQDDGTWSDENIALGGLSFGEEGGAGDQQQASDFAFAPFAVSGVGILCAGYTAPNMGDVLSLGVEEGTWKGLGSYGARLADGFVFQSVAMVGNTPYIAALRTPDDGTSSTLGALYTLPDAAAAQLGTLTRTATAVAQQGGTATVADWRGGSAQSVAMTAHDSATWEAAPAEGYRFVGWYEGETLISSEATYKAPVLFDTVLTARFAPIETAGTPNSEGAGASDGEALADTGDATPTLTFALAGLALLSCAAIALSVVRRRCSE